MTYLTSEEIIVIHHRIIEETGGSQGIRDMGLLFSIAEKPKTIIAGIEVYASKFQKATVLLEALVNYHVFVDGNKRTAFASTETFLRINGNRLNVNTNQVHVFMLAVANKKYSRKEIAKWIERHSKPL